MDFAEERHARAEAIPSSASSCSACWSRRRPRLYRLKDQQARGGHADPARRPRGDRRRPSGATSRSSSSFTADILPAKQAAIFSKVSGYIRKIHVDRGDFVQGRPAPRRDRRPGAAGLGRAGARRLVGSARRASRSPAPRSRAEGPTSRTSARTWPRPAPSPTNDTRQAERMKTLFEKGLVSATDWDNARTTADSSQASVQTPRRRSSGSPTSRSPPQESQVRLAQAQVETYRAALALARDATSATPGCSRPSRATSPSATSTRAPR